MSYVCVSHFKEYIVAMLQYKRALGFSYIESERILCNFDRFYYDNFPNETIFTREIGMKWAQMKDSEQSNAFRNRMMPVRQLAKYMQSIGINAYIIPSSLARKKQRPAVHIYTKEELKAFFNVADTLPYKKCSPARHLIIPVFFRVLYCCGLRPAEARNLLVKSVDLSAGKFNIVESKGHKDRVVILSEELLELVLKYHKQVSNIFPNRKYFFPSLTEQPYTKKWLEKTFRVLWKKAGTQDFNTIRPRPYDFRHTFSTNCLYQWLKEGKDLNAYLPYLSAYLGHTQLSDTAYYIHLVPEFFPQMANMDFEKFSKLIPEVDYED